MRSSKPHLRLVRILAIAFTMLLLAAAPAAAQQEQVLYSFSGSNPQAGVTFDAAGNLYGTQAFNVYKLAPQAGGGWTESVIYSFTGSQDAEGTLAQDAAGNLYGVTIGGSTGNGTVFQLTQSGGSWTPNTLYSFPSSGRNGISPYGDPVLDAAGNIYGTTFYGGRYGSGSSGGVAWRLSPQTGGGYTFKVLHNFGNGSDGQEPFAGMILDSSGNLYGTTVAGGSKGFGTVFELIPQADGSWKEKILHNFASGFDGQGPRAKLTFDAAGNLYGTTNTGGRYGLGTAFQLIPQADGTWKEKFLHHFGNGSDGAYLYSNLVFDTAGSLYGATFFGGQYGGGIVFKLVPQSDGTWSEKIVHRFGNGGDGNGPLGDVTFDASGSLFGTTIGGGSNFQGTVWKISF